jgi:hypothetical protein
VRSSRDDRSDSPSLRHPKRSSCTCFVPATQVLSVSGGSSDSKQA